MEILDVTSSVLNTIKTVDELVDYCIDDDILLCEFDVVDMVVNHIIEQQYSSLLSILLSKENKPSKYDLIIINAIAEVINNKNVMYNKQNHWKSILEIYKKRKN